MSTTPNGKVRHKQPINPNHSLSYNPSQLKVIYLAGGCFWGLEAYMSRVYGVFDAVSGYANGKTENPTYEQVCRENTGHAETVRIEYDPDRVHLKALLAYYFKVIDPTSINRQGGDTGAQYRTGIYYTDPHEAAIIQEVIREQQQHYSKPIVVEVQPLKHFFEAEAYHQDYLEKNPSGYCHIDLFEVETPVVPPTLYKKPNVNELKQRLTDIQLIVTQESATERPFQNQYWDFFEAGLYVDITTGEPLFFSTDKFESSCGWPSFSKPIEEAVVRFVEDHSHGMRRVEVRSRVGDAHLGHVFDDGPRDRGGKRYCINSASLLFVPVSEMESKGYGYLIPAIL